MLMIIVKIKLIMINYMFIIRMFKNYKKNFNIIRVDTFLKYAIFPIFYM